MGSPRQRSKANRLQSSHPIPSRPASGNGPFETLESRQMFSIALLEQPVSTQSLSTSASLSQTIAPGALHASSKQAAGAKAIATFQTALVLEVHKHLALQNSPAFQQKIAKEQTAFAAKMLKKGVTYTPVAFDVLLTEATTPKLTATVLSAGQIDLSWTAVPGATSYKLERSTNNGKAWIVAGSPAGTSFSDLNLSANTNFTYRVSGVSSDATSAVSNKVSANPSKVTAALSRKIQAFTIQVSRFNAGIQKEITKAGAKSTTAAFLAHIHGEETAFAAKMKKLGFTYTPPSAPGSLSAFVVGSVTPPTVSATAPSANEVDLSWTAVTGAIAYKLEVSTNAGSTWTVAAFTTTTSFANVGLTADTAYSYQVTAITSTASSSPSTAVNITTPLAPPTSFSATASSSTNINLAWTAVTHATNYKIERSADNVTWTALVPSPALTGSSTSYADASVTAGSTYYYRISSIDAAGLSAPTVAITATSFPAAPVLTATLISASEIDLSWPAINSAFGYNVERSTDAGTTWTSRGTVSTNVFNDTGLTADTAYQYRVSAINASGSSAASNVQSLTTFLAAPTGFSATEVSATEIDLAWTAVTHATTYKIERSTDQTTWTILTPSPALAGTDASYHDTSVSAGTTYYYRISSSNSVGFSAPSSSVNALTVPAAPTLTATVISATAVDLSWTGTTGATSYLLETSADSGTTWTTLATQATTLFHNTALTADTGYQYRVTAINAAGSSALSSVQTVTTLLPTPTGFTATPSTSALSIGLAWTAVTDATSYTIERSLDQTTWTALTPSPALTGSSAAYSDTGLTAGTTYYYRISAVNSVGTSIATTAVSGLTIPAAPTLTAASPTATSVNLSWTASPGATSYLVENSSDGSNWTSAVTQAGLTYTNTGLTSDTAYQFRVSAIDATGSSAPSTAATSNTLLLAPTGLATTPSTTLQQIALAWTAVTDATSYTIERSVDQTTWTAIVPGSPFDGTTVAYTDTGLTPGTTYYYRISAVNVNGSSAPSTAVTGLTIPAVPTLTPSVFSATQVNVSWSASSGAATYLLEESPDGATWTSLASQAGTTFSNTGLTADTAYEYRVTATDATGSSVPSSVQTVTTLLPTPTNFAATVVSAGEVDLAWTPVTHALSYKIERSVDQSTWTTLTPSPLLTGASNSYADTTVLPVTSYYYRISAQNFVGNSAPTTAAHVLTKPVAPTLAGTVVSATSVTLTWNAVTGSTSYKVESSADGGTTWTVLASPTLLTYSPVGLTADTAYKFRVSSVTANGTSAPSTVVPLTTALPAPTGLAVVAPSSTEIDLSWTAQLHATTYKLERSLDGTTWTTLAPNPALTQASAAYVDHAVTAGTTYYYRISGTNALGTSVASAAVHIATRAPAPVVTPVVVSATAINLGWTAIPGATSYKVESSSDGGATWTVLGNPSAATFSVTGLTADTAYKFRVSTTNSGGTGAPSTVITSTTQLPAPSNFALTAVSSKEIDLSWTALAHATTYKIERSLDGNTWAAVTVVPILAGGASTYADTTLTASTTYYYRISGVNTAGTSVPSTAQHVSTKPLAPVVTAAVASSSVVNLSWAAVAGATSYKVESSSDGGTTWTVLASPTTLTYSATGLSADTTYKFRVSTNASSGTSIPSTVVSAATILGTPTGVSAVAISTTEIDLSWTAVPHATTYKIERSPDGSTWTAITPTNVLTGNTSSYADTTVTGGGNFYYRISSVNAAGTSAASSSVHVLTVPATPTLTATVVSPTQVNLSWTASTSATGYKVERAPAGSNNFTVIASPTGITYSNTGLTADTGYRYRVSAINASGTSLASAVASVTTPLPAPTGFTATATSATDVTITWNAVADATGYKIERSLNNSTWTALTPSPALTGSDTTFDDATAQAGTGYYYRISSLNAVGTSATTLPLFALTPLAAPAGLVATTASATQVNLTWTKTASITLLNYVLQRSLDGATWTTVTSPDSSATSFNNTGLTTSTTYYFRLLAVNPAGNSAPSNIVSATTA